MLNPSSSPWLAAHADVWDAQMVFFANKGYRVIAHDRRSHAVLPGLGTTTQ